MLDRPADAGQVRLPARHMPGILQTWRVRRRKQLVLRATRRELNPATPTQRLSPVSAGTTWLHDLEPEKRRALAELHEIKPSWNYVVALYPLMLFITSAAILAFPYWFVRVPAYFVSGVAIHAMTVLTHEASHYSIFRSRRWDRWVGFLMGAPVFVSHTAYRVLHAYHHRYTREAGDPDEFKNVTRHRFLLSLLFYSWIFIGTPIYLVHVTITALVKGSRRDRVDIVVEYALLAAIFGSIYFLIDGSRRVEVLVHCWALPMCVAMVFGNLRSWAEHTMTIPGNPLTSTRTVTSNRVVSFLMCNLNYHLEHHLCPGIPWYNLPKMHAIMQSEYRAAGSFVYRSYWRFLWDALRNGIHGVSWVPFPMM